MAVDTSTDRTGLARVARVNAYDDTALLLGLVGEKAAQLSETPAVETSLFCALALLNPTTDVGQVLHRDNRACDYGVHDLPTELMVQVAPKPKLFASEPTKMSLRALGAFGLKTTLEPKVPGFKFAPAALTEESIVSGRRTFRCRCDGGTNDAEVYSDNLAVGVEGHVGQRDHNVQPEPSFT